MNVDIKDARPGMVLSEPAKDASGRVLLPAGQELTEKHVQKLARFGVSSLTIRDAADDKEDAPVTPDDVGKLDEHLSKIFRAEPEDELMKDLRSIARGHLLAKSRMWGFLR